MAPDILSIGGSVDLIRIEAAADAFGTQPDRFLQWLSYWGVPVLDVEGTKFLNMFTLERELFRRTVRPTPSEADLDSCMERVSQYRGAAHERAILESLRHYSPVYHRATSPNKRENRRNDRRPRGVPGRPRKAPAVILDGNGGR